ncbi:MAG: TetR/AcrR family transcriptional regulator [Ilumatobacteraceae bacterium]
MEVVADPRPDGRRVRGERNKDAVVRALLSLYDEGEIEPSAARIAEVAGVSERSVFRYFEDKDDLAATAMTLQMDRVQHLYEALDSSGDFDARLDAILTHRIGLFDAVRGVMRASEVLEHRSEVVRSAMDRRRSFLRKQAVAQFETEISAHENDRADVARAIEVTLSLETVHYLDRRHPRSTLRTTLEFMARSILGQH